LSYLLKLKLDLLFAKLPLDYLFESTVNFFVSSLSSGLSSCVGGVEVILVGFAGDYFSSLGKLESFGYRLFCLDFHYDELSGLYIVNAILNAPLLSQERIV
jgi:hypothetical protein